MNVTKNVHWRGVEQRKNTWTKRDTDLGLRTGFKFTLLSLKKIFSDVQNALTLTWVVLEEMFESSHNVFLT